MQKKNERNGRKMMENLKRKETRDGFKILKNKKEKGITLIALVITIIVLLILAGVTIATLIGDNGILTKVNDAKRETEIAEVKERAQLDITSWVADKIKNGEDGVIPLPDGFAYIGGTKSEGIVISDNPNDAGKGRSSGAF